ncbi:hypothetical protein J5681_04930, partial [bacterium]|nr:hypothetical protein [bacterium]
MTKKAVISRYRYGFFLFFVSSLAFLVSSCFGDCSSSNAYSYQCNGIYLEQCRPNGGDYYWEQVTNCAIGCPSDIGTPSCSSYSYSCSCSVPSKYLCEH